MALFDNLRAPQGMFGASQPQASAMPVPIASAPARTKPGFNDPGGWAEKLGALGGVFLNAGGMPNDAFQQYQQLKQHRRDQAMKLQEDEVQRQQALQDWVSKETWKRTNPDQSDLQARVEYLNTFKPGLGETYAQNYALYGGSQPMPQIVTTPQGTFMVPRTGATPQTGTPTNPAPGSIDGGFRFKGGNPADHNNWEPVGGPTPSASGIFR